jgi:serine/threonine protein kinase
MLDSTFAGYTVLERINRGGMADIYLAADRDGRQRVLRVLLPTLRFHWTSRRRFRWGCEVESRLDHPNVARCFEYGTFHGRLYAVLEYVPGPNLKECILRSDPMLGQQRLHLLVGMASGLAHIHEHGFLHLDFKPENVLVTRGADAKIIDFDLAIERPSEPKRVRRLSGTPAYLAPEQIHRQPVDERADIFAFGLTAYEMLTGKKPVTGNTFQEVMRKYANFEHHLKPLRAHVDDIPHAIERVVLKCLERDVARRYPSMSLVVRDLQS